MPLISIIIPIWKTEKYIRQCIDALVVASTNACEIILVDDGSPDTCPVICDEYKEKYSFIKVIHKKNGGHSSARKAGLEIAQGKYIGFVDSDDYIGLDYFLTLSEIVEKFEPDVIAFDITKFDGGVQSILKNDCEEGFYYGHALDEKIKKRLLYDEKSFSGSILFSMCSKWIRKDLINEGLIKVPNTIVMGEDLATVVPIIAKCSSVYVSRYNGYFYRNNPNSTVNTFRAGDADNYEILAAFLKKELGQRYYNKINVYLLLQIKYYIFEVLKHSSTYRQFKKVVSDNISRQVYKAIKSVHVLQYGRKEQILTYLCKHRKYFLLWLVKKIKGLN